MIRTRSVLCCGSCFRPGRKIVGVAEGFQVEARLTGESARELNRTLLSALRRTCRRTRIRAEWTDPDGTRERFFDYTHRRSSTPR